MTRLWICRTKTRRATQRYMLCSDSFVRYNWSFLGHATESWVGCVSHAVFPLFSLRIGSPAPPPPSHPWAWARDLDTNRSNRLCSTCFWKWRILKLLPSCVFGCLGCPATVEPWPLLLMAIELQNHHCSAQNKPLGRPPHPFQPVILPSHPTLAKYAHFMIKKHRDKASFCFPCYRLCRSVWWLVFYFFRCCVIVTRNSSRLAMPWFLTASASNLPPE